MKQLIAQTQQRLRELGIDLIGDLADGASVTLARGRSKQKYRVIVAADKLATIQQVQAFLVAHSAVSAPSERVLVVSDFATLPFAATTDGTGIDYVDASGNAGIEFGDVLIRVRGKRPRNAATPLRDESLTARAGSHSTNPFSPVRSRVVFALLTWPHLLNSTIRETAQAAGTSQGSVHLTNETLRELEYTLKTPNGIQWRDWSQTAEAWLATYPSTLGRTLSLTTLSGDIDRPKKVLVDDPVFVSGESAFDPELAPNLAYSDQLLRPTTLTLYVEDYDVKLAIRNRWRADGHPNIFIRQKFWKSPDHADAPLAGFRAAPRLLVIADLLSTNEPRQMKTARELLVLEHERHK